MMKKVVALAATLACGLASASTAIDLVQDPDDLSIWSASFSAKATGDNVFTIDLSAFVGYELTLLPAIVQSNFSSKRGYDITSVTLDGEDFYAVDDDTAPNIAGIDTWVHTQSLTAGVHTLVVNGKLLGGSTGFIGSLNVIAQPVPEPETYALMLAGLGAVGFMARRRIGR